MNALRVTAGRDLESSRSVGSYTEDIYQRQSCHPSESFQLGL